MNRIAFAVAAVLLLCSSLFAAPPKDLPLITLPITYSFTKINYPNSIFDLLLGINDDGYIVGFHGLEPEGGFTLVPSPGCPPKCDFKSENYPGSISTAVVGINNDNDPNFETAGYWVDKAGNYHGFMRNSKAWIDVDYPDTTDNELLGLNDNDVAAGYYEDGAGNDHPYIYSQPGNQYIPLIIPGSNSAWAADINDYNVIVGVYYDSSGDAHGFELNPFFTALNYPAATQTWATGINNYGAIVGRFVDTSGEYHGFIYYGGTWEQLNDPDSVGATLAWGVNDNFDIVGYGNQFLFSFFGWEAIPE
jgi:probable HAF family extracellular repeat protein